MPSCCSRLFCQHSHDNVEDEENSSNVPDIGPRDSSPIAGGDVMVNVSATVWNVAFYEDDNDFDDLLKQSELAIENEVLPVMIIKGSSGSYFVKNVNNEHIGVFKPKDEEPYGALNPKWAKWFQKHCCPCCFGRGCLIPNSGYLSEAGASLVDIKLQLNVVPKTKVIRMASSTFHYGKIKRETARAKKSLADRFPAVGRRFHRIGLPLKIGSFQTFVTGFRDAIEWIQHFEVEPLSEDVAHEFQLEFERLVILDYVIRNTDRGNDNWLIKYDNSSPSELEKALLPFSLGPVAPNIRRRVKVAAIDNGLAFPFKHPDQWRAYPFHWAKLHMAKIPFSQETRDKYLPLLSNVCVIEELCSDLFCLFSMDKSFQKSVFDRQMSVLRGQVLNLVNAIREGRSPLQLVQMPPVIVLKCVEYPDLQVKNYTSSSSKLTLSTPQPSPSFILASSHSATFEATHKVFSDISENYKPEFPQEVPIFTSW